MAEHPLKNYEHSGYSSVGITIANITEVHEKIIHEDHWQTIHNICETSSLSYGTCQGILSDELENALHSSKFVPCLVIKKHKKLIL